MGDIPWSQVLYRVGFALYREAFALYCGATLYILWTTRHVPHGIYKICSPRYIPHGINKICSPRHIGFLLHGIKKNLFPTVYPPRYIKNTVPTVYVYVTHGVNVFTSTVYKFPPRYILTRANLIVADAVTIYRGYMHIPWVKIIYRGSVEWGTYSVGNHILWGAICCG